MLIQPFQLYHGYHLQNIQISILFFQIICLFESKSCLLESAYSQFLLFLSGLTIIAYVSKYIYISTLSRYNSHTIQFTPLKCINKCSFISFTELCNHHHNQLQNIFITPKKALYTLAVTPHVPQHPPALRNLKSTFYSYRFLYMDKSYKQNYSTWSFVTDFFHLAYYFQNSYMLQHLLVWHLFL